MDLIAIKTRIKANLKIKDLVKKPFPAETYKKLFHNNVAQIHNSILCKNLTTACVDWIDLLALQTHISIKKSRPDWSHGYLIYHLINDYIKKNGSKTIHYFETGTAKGFSVLVATKAIIDNKVTPSLITVDIIDHHKKRYWNSIKDESGRKSRKELLHEYEHLTKYINFETLNSNKIKQKIFTQKIDIAFLDGAHSYRELTKEFNFLLKHMCNQGIIIFDDYNDNKYPGINKFIEKLPKEKLKFVLQRNLKSFAIYTN